MKIFRLHRRKDLKSS